jgi:hypothetical protein
VELLTNHSSQGVSESYLLVYEKKAPKRKEASSSKSGSQSSSSANASHD